VLRAKGPSSRSVLDCGSPLPAFLSLTIRQSPITIHAPCAARDRTLSSSLFAGSYAIGLSPFDVSSLTSGASRYPFAFPIHLKFNSINLVRGLYRKERTDHGRQPALLHCSSAYTYSYVLLIPARPTSPSSRVARASRVLVSASRRNDSLLTTSALSAQVRVRQDEADSCCSLLLALPLHGRQPKEQEN